MASIAIRSKGQGLSAEQAAPSSGEVAESIQTPAEPIVQASAKPVPEVTAEPAPEAERFFATEALGRVTPRSARPKYAYVSAQIAQFDADADPDGWLANVMLMDAEDRPVSVPRASAKFELMPRVPTHDFTGYVNANVKPISWTVPLQFSADKVAIARLKLRQPLSPLAGWTSESHPAVGAAGGFYSSRRGIIRHSHPDYRSRTAATDRQYRGGAIDAIGLAGYGQLKVRVSVPGEGTFDAVAPIELRPAVLVDTRWPYQ